jgi:kynurenine formamidase
LNARISIGGREVSVDLSQPVPLALELDFAGPQPQHFGAPRASAHAFEVPGFNGSVARGASCNCEVISLIPHCNGTHTEAVGHLTRDRLNAWRVIPAGLLPALLVSVAAEPAEASGEDTDPVPQPNDWLVTRRALERAWPAGAALRPQALVVRTLPNSPEKRAGDYGLATPPYLSRQAARLLVERGIWHLIVDLPSIDRASDEGRLTAHRIFFGLPRGSVELADASRAEATITELAFIPDELGDGLYLLELQAPALGGDAVPSRPLLFRLERMST